MGRLMQFRADPAGWRYRLSPRGGTRDRRGGMTNAELRARLAQVLWIGGPPDAGKSTVAATLGWRYGVPVYHFDRHEPAHFAPFLPALSPVE